MKKTIMLFMLTILSLSMHAQQRMDHYARGERQSEKMKMALSLSESQYTTIKSIQEKYRNKISELRKDSTLTKDVLRNKAQAINQQRQNEVNNVLTAEQQAKWKTYREERKSERKERHSGKLQRKGEMKGRDHARRSDQMKTELQLSDDQVNKMKVEHEAMKEKMQRIRTDQSLTPETRKAKAEVLRAEHEQAVKAILTADQFEKWKSRKGTLKETPRKR